MTFATAPIAADLGIREPLMAAICRAAGAFRAAIERHNARRDYRRLLQNDEGIRDVGVTRGQVCQALLKCGGHGH